MIKQYSHTALSGLSFAGAYYAGLHPALMYDAPSGQAEMMVPGIVLKGRDMLTMGEAHRIIIAKTSPGRTIYANTGCALGRGQI